MSLEAKKFLDNKQEQHLKQFGVYADVNSKLAEWIQEYKDKEINNQKVISIIEDLIFEDIIIEESRQEHYWQAVEKAKDLIKILKQI